METKTKLPEWLNKHLFHTLKARHSPDPHAVKHSFEFDLDQLRIYLGTYFPRSYAETFCIFSALFGNTCITQCLGQRNTLKVLVIGAGTGGDIAGLLAAVHDYIPGIREIDLTAYDSNCYALTFCDSILRVLKSEYAFAVKWRPHLWQFIEQEFPKIHGKYDIVMTSKVFNELMNKGYKCPYHDFTKMYLPLLTEFGICAMIDVTIPINGEFLPKLMNNQINEALCELHKQEQFGTLLPEFCRESWIGYDCCCDFVSYQFCAQHRVISEAETITNESQVIYRVLARKNFVQAARITTATPWLKSPERCLVNKEEGSPCPTVK